MRLSLRAAALAVLAFASTAGAQAPSPATESAPARHRFTVTPRAGFIAFDEASGIESSAALGLDATYQLTSMFGLSLSSTFSRPSTRGEDFIGAIYIGDTTFLYRAQQPITVVDLNLGATARMPFGNFVPYLQGGVGGYTLFLDPQASGGSDPVSQGLRNRVQRMSLNVGGGLGYRITDRIGVSVDVRDMIFLNYDRDRLNPVSLAARDTRFIEDFPAPPTEKKTVHNLAIQLGFSFVPSRSQSPAPEGTP